LDLHFGAAGEVDAVVEPFGEKEQDRQNDRGNGDPQPEMAFADEVDISARTNQFKH
jgi:hypothetical protein